MGVRVLIGRRGRVAALGVAVAAGAALVAGAGPALADSSSSGGLSITSITVGIGSGTSAEPITIAAGSPIVGSTGPIAVYGTDGASYITGMSADSSTNATCTSGASVGVQGLTWGYTCTPSSAGWGAGHLRLKVDAGGRGASPSLCAPLCSFGTTAAWSGPGGYQASGAVFLKNEADLSVTFSQLSSDSATLVARSAGPSFAQGVVVTVTGLGDYTVGNVAGQCRQDGDTLTCSMQLGSGGYLPLQPTFSGGTGTLALNATISAEQLTASGATVPMADPNPSNNSASLTWTPVLSGPVVGASTGTSDPAAVAATSPDAPSTTEPAASPSPASAAASDTSAGTLVTLATAQVESPSAARSTGSVAAAASGRTGGFGAAGIWLCAVMAACIGVGVVIARRDPDLGADFDEGDGDGDSGGGKAN